MHLLADPAIGRMPRRGGAQLDEVLPPTWSHANPIDLIGDATDARYTETLQILLADDAVDGILVMN